MFFIETETQNDNNRTSLKFRRGYKDSMVFGIRNKTVFRMIRTQNRILEQNATATTRSDADEDRKVCHKKHKEYKPCRRPTMVDVSCLVRRMQVVHFFQLDSLPNHKR
jgi:hypothetical protein